MSVDLKPCPFCGGEAELQILPIANGYVKVQCTVCEASTRIFTRGNLDSLEKEVVKLWNMRVALG